MITKLFIGTLVVLIAFFSSMQAEEQAEELIINPTIGGYSSMPILGSRMIRSDSFVGPIPAQGETRYDRIPGTETQGEWPDGVLVKGRVPNIGKRWAVAVTRDEAEFLQALPEFKRLMAEGRQREARQILHISTSINIASSVEEFLGDVKTRDVPEEVGRFWFMLSTNEYLKYGGCLTFLSFTPDPDYPTIGIGQDIGEKIHGKLMITTVEGDQYFKNRFGMEIVKAKIVEPKAED